MQNVMGSTFCCVDMEKYKWNIGVTAYGESTVYEQISNKGHANVKHEKPKSKNVCSVAAVISSV